MANKDEEFEELLKSGEAKFIAGDFEGAIKGHDKAINLNPADKNRLAEAYGDRGLAKNKLGRREEAIADFDEAMRLCDEAIEIDSENARAWYNRGFAKGGLGRHEEAIEDYDEAIRLDPEFASAWNSRGFAKNKLGRKEEGLADYEEAIRLNPEFASAWNNLGSAKSQLGRHENAIANLDEAIRLDSEYVTAWNNRGLAKGELGRHEEAIADYDEAIRLNPKNVTAWNKRGVEKYKFGNFDDAQKDFDQALMLSPDDFDIRNNLSAVATRKSINDNAERKVDEIEKAEEYKRQSEEYKRREKEHRESIRCEMNYLGKIIIGLIAGLIVLILGSVYSGILKIGDVVSNPFSLLPWITMIVIITSSRVWKIRLLIAAANKAELMQAEYEHLFLVERRMLVYFAKHDTHEGKQIRIDCIKATMTNSPADKLLAFQNKANVPSKNIVEKIVKQD